MIDLKKFEQIRKKVQDSRSEVERARGALDQQMKILKEQFGCDSIEEAKKQLENLKEEEKQIEISYNVALDAFEQKWGDLLR